MIFNTIRLVGANTIDLPLEGVGPLSPYVLKAADGLGPPEVDVSIARTLLSGGKYQGRRPQLREVVLRVGLQPEWNIGQTVQELRSNLYGLLTPRYGNMVELHVMNDDQLVVTTEGQLSRLEIAPFSKDPEVQVTLKCLEPYLSNPTELEFNPTWVDGAVFSDVVINNAGTAPTGFIAEIKFDTVFAGTFVLADALGYSGEQIKVTQDFDINDTIIIDTRPGSRGVWRRRVGFVTQQSILAGLDPTSTWLQLHNGNNTLRANHLGVSWGTGKLKMVPQYWGI